MLDRFVKKVRMKKQSLNLRIDKTEKNVKNSMMKRGEPSPEQWE